MKKRVLTLLIGFFAIASLAQAANNSPLQNAIQKYKKGNYSGCIQDLENYTKNEQSNALAYYYLAIANTQAGRKDEALEAYNRVLALKPNPTLSDYATKGKICIEEPENCYRNASQREEDSDLDKFIKSNEYVRHQDSKTDLDSLRNRINSGEEISPTEFKEIEKNTNNSSKPSNDEIANAVRVLNSANLMSFTTQPQANIQQANAPQMSQQQMQQQMQMQQMMGQMQQQNMNPQYNDIQMLLGNKNNNNSSNNFMNMLPFILSQGNNPQNGGRNNFSPEVIQAMMMNSMMPDLNFSTSDK